MKLPVTDSMVLQDELDPTRLGLQTTYLLQVFFVIWQSRRHWFLFAWTTQADTQSTENTALINNINLQIHLDTHCCMLLHIILAVYNLMLAQAIFSNISSSSEV